MTTERLRGARRANGLPLADLARASKLSEAMVSRFENGERNLGAASMARYRAALVMLIARRQKLGGEALEALLT